MYPIARDNSKIKVALFDWPDFACVALHDLRAREVRKGGKAVIELVEELSFIEWKVEVVIQGEVVAFKGAARIL